MSANPRFLVVDGYTRHGRSVLIEGGASVASDLYVEMLGRCAPSGASCDVAFVADADVYLPAPLASYDGVCWTGSSLAIYDDLPEVRRQIELARKVFELGIPSFGSCWAAQVAVVAAGGEVALNPKGREAGLARKITLTDAGLAHPMYVGKAKAFDAFTSHDDIVVSLPPGATLLAGNRYAEVQAVSVEWGRGTFWAVQYHPEYSLADLARLTVCRMPLMLRLGFFQTRADGMRYVQLLDTLARDPSRSDLAWLLGIDADVLDPAQRTLEVKNWIERLVLPSMER